MAELWIPGLDDTFDASNTYDMMLLYQEQFDKISDPEDIESWYPFAMRAIRTLEIAIRSMSSDERQIKVATEFAVFQSIEDKDVQIEMEDVGMRGTIDDVHCCVKLGGRIGPYIGLGIDVESIYPITDPDEGNYILMTAFTPISKVHYIEQAAA